MVVPAQAGWIHIRSATVSGTYPRGLRRDFCRPWWSRRCIVQMYRDLIALRRKPARKPRGLTGQNLSPRSVRVGGDDRVRTHCVSLLVPSQEAADCNHQYDAGEANRKLHRDVAADGGQQDLAEHREQDSEAEHL